MLVLILALTATVVRAQEETEISELPPQVLKGMDMLHQAYKLEAFDCDNPEEVVTQSIPHSCSVKSLGKPHLTVETESNPKHDYTILQRVLSFEYPALMCVVRRSGYHYDCVWKSHVRVAAPPEDYQRETIQVHDCANLAATGTFMDPKSGAKHNLNTKLEINHFSTTMVGTISYYNSHLF